MKVWSVVGSATAVTTNCDLVEIVPAANRPVIIYSVRVSQKNRSQDAQDAQQRIQLVRGNTTAGSGGSSATPAAVGSGADGATAGATCKVFNSTIASAGTAVVVVEDCFDVRAGWLYVPTPDERDEISVATANNRLCVRLPDAPSASTTYSITVKFAEIG
jgi:hypothetical protein